MQKYRHLVIAAVVLVAGLFLFWKLQKPAPPQRPTQAKKSPQLPPGIPFGSARQLASVPIPQKPGKGNASEVETKVPNRSFDFDISQFYTKEPLTEANKNDFRYTNSGYGFRFADKVSLEAVLGPGRSVEMLRVELLGPDSFNWVGRIDGNPHDDFTLSYFKGAISGVFRADRKAYEFNGMEKKPVVMKEVDWADVGRDSVVKGPKLAPDPNPKLSSKPGEINYVPAAGEAVTVDIYFVYTTAAKNGAGGSSQIIAQINAGVALTNTTFQNSGLSILLRVVGTSETTYVSTTSTLTDIERLRTPGDGYLDDVEALRVAAGADLVSLVTETKDVDNCGRASMPTLPLDYNNFGQAATIFYVSVLPRACTLTYNMPHEIGHNMGCFHERENSSSPPSYPYAYGYYSGTIFKTTMSYKCANGVVCPGIPYFSTPTKSYNGRAVGKVDTEECAKAIGLNAPFVSAYGGVNNLLPSPVMILTQPVGKNLSPAQSLSLSVQASGYPTPTYQWRKNGVNIFGATNRIYTVSSVALADAGSYDVVVSNAAGSVTSSAALVTVVAATPIALNVGQTLNITAPITGMAGWTYQWRKSSIDIVGATALTYSKANVTSSDAGTYSLVVKKSPTTNDFLTVAIVTVLTPPSFSFNPNGRTVNEGVAFYIDGAVSLSTSQPVTFRWKKNGTIIPGGTSTSATRFRLDVIAATPQDAGSYTLEATNAAGTVESTAAVIVVRTIPVITMQPVGQTLNAGQTLTLTAAATGIPAPNFRWKKDGVAFTGNGGFTPTVTIANVTAANAGTYTVDVSNFAGTVVSNPAIVTVNEAPTAPTITTQPMSQTITAGEPIILTVVAAGTAPLSYQWKKAGVNITGATSSTFTKISSVVGDTGAYTCTVSNSIGSVNSNAANVTVNAAPVAPTITTQPMSQTINVGQPLNLSVVATGTAPLTYQWKKAGAIISGATAANYSIAAVAAVDAGLFSVTVSNSVGSVNSNDAVVTVSAAPVPASISVQPVGGTIPVNNNFSLSVTAVGTAPISYQWMKNGNNIAGATAATLNFAPLNWSDAGIYTVKVSNSLATVTSIPAEIKIPAIPRDPAGGPDIDRDAGLGGP